MVVEELRCEVTQPVICRFLWRARGWGWGWGWGGRGLIYLDTYLVLASRSARVNVKEDEEEAIISLELNTVRWLYKHEKTQHSLKVRLRTKVDQLNMRRSAHRTTSYYRKNRRKEL